MSVPDMFRLRGLCYSTGRHQVDLRLGEWVGETYTESVTLGVISIEMVFKAEGMDEIT